MIIDTIPHEEAVIHHFMEDPELAQIMLQDAIAEGDVVEEQKIRRRINEAKSRQYWSEIVSNAEQTAKSRHNLEATLGLVDKALEILKAAVSA